MNLEELYSAIGSNFSETLSRLPSEALIKKLLLKFIDDKSMSDLESALASGDVETAFRAAHTLKGVALNMNFAKLAEVSSEVTELLRGKENGTGAVNIDPELMGKLKEEYSKIIQSIKDM